MRSATMDGPADGRSAGCGLHDDLSPVVDAIAKALKIDRAIRGNVYAYQLFRTYVGRLGFMLPLELDFHAFRVLPSTARLFLDIGANDGISARSFRLFNKTTPFFRSSPIPATRRLSNAPKLPSILSTTGFLPQASDAAS